MVSSLTWTFWFVSFVVSTWSSVTAQATNDSWAGASPAFVQLSWSNASLLEVSLAESPLVTGIKSFYTTEAVKVVSVRNSSLIITGRTSFEVLFLIGDPTLAFNTTMAPAALNATGLATALGQQLQAAILNATTSVGADGSTISTDNLDPLWKVVSSFQSGSVTCQTLSNAGVLAVYKSAPNFPAIRTTAAPKSAFLAFTVRFSIVNNPTSLAESVVFQVRHGVGRFLGDLGGGFNMSYVVSAGPAVADSTLRVNQNFFLVLPPTADTSMLAREAVANLLMYGDLRRLVTGDSAGTTRPSMFLDSIFPSAELVTAMSSNLLASSQPFAATLFQYVFQSLRVNTFPDGNPALPATATNDTATLLSAVSEDALNVLRRKQQRFLYDPAGYLAALPQNVSYPTDITMDKLDISGDFATTVYWSNTLTQEFWLERAESIESLSWNLFPSTPFFVADTSTVSSSSSSSILPSSPLLPSAPIVKIGNTSTPLWTLQGATPEHLDMAFYLRSADDNVTLVKVEVAVTLHASGDAESTVTSIARAAGNSTSSNSSSVNPVNVVVRHQSRLLRNGTTDKPSKLLLFLELGVATVTEKSADNCAHCQQLSDWCTNEAGCAALKTCVLTAIQSPISQLVNATSTLSKTDDLYPIFNKCLSGSTTSTVDVNSLMLFTSAIRCQLQRFCAFPSPSSSIIVPTGSKLVWESGQGQTHLEPVSGITNFPLPTSTPVNISLSIGGKVVCYLPVWSNATASSLETKIARSCTFAKYLGAVKADVASNAVGATSVGLFYAGLVGPMPALMSVSSDTQGVAIGATITTVSTPSIHLRLDSASGPTPYASTTDQVQVKVCAECKRLALDVCLRDAKCAAMADCILQYKVSSTSTSTNGTTTTETNAAASSTSVSLSNAILQLVRGDVVGQRLSVEPGVSSCLPATTIDGVSSVDVSGASWRKLVNASACYSRTACPVVLAPMLSSSSTTLGVTYTTVGKWSVSPAQKLQRLIYSGSTSSLSELKVPLVLTRDSVKVTAISAADPVSLAAALRTLIQYDDIAVVQTAVDSSSGSTTSTSGSTTSSSESSVTTFAWTISYGHWVGALPYFISTTNTEWTLVAYPTVSSSKVVPNDSVFELAPRVTNSTA